MNGRRSDDRTVPANGDEEPAFAERRARMVARVAEVVRDSRVLAAMRSVPRHEFVPQEVRRYAYADRALAIGHRQTISQPLIVGVMTEALAPKPSDRVLEVGTGSGYQAAVVARLARDVVTVEIVDVLRRRAAATLERLGLDHVDVLAAGEEPGAPALAPFDAILVAAAAPAVPPPLIDQLADGGRLVIPVGPLGGQELWLLTRRRDAIERRSLGGVRFVPLLGRDGYGRGDDDRDAGEPPP